MLPGGLLRCVVVACEFYLVLIGTESCWLVGGLIGSLLLGAHCCLLSRAGGTAAASWLLLPSLSAVAALRPRGTPGSAEGTSWGLAVPLRGW